MRGGSVRHRVARQPWRVPPAGGGDSVRGRGCLCWAATLEETRRAGCERGATVRAGGRSVVGGAPRSGRGREHAYAN
eukprot:5388002-Prymnesium_polylepis.1